MIPIIFSIPIHEKLEVVFDQIENYKFFNPDCGIVLHFSKKFDYGNSAITREEFEEKVRNIGNIFINPISVRTGWADIIQAHLSNFYYVKEQCEFEFFALCASNELFIRAGLYQWIREYDCGIKCGEVTESTSTAWPQGKMAQKDAVLKKILQEIGGKKIICAQVEGTFFRRALFDDICEVINRNYDYRSMEFPYPREEIYFSTIIGNWKEQGKKINLYLNGFFTFIPWYEEDFRIKIEDIKRLREENAQYFSVKRIERDVNDNIRKYIREEIGKGYLDCRRQLIETHDTSGTALYGNTHLQSILSFDGRDISGLLHDMITCLELAKEHGLEVVSHNIVSLLEDEYADAVLEGILQENMDILNLMVQINGIIHSDATGHIIRPLQWILLYVYEKALLRRIGGEDKIALYGAGRYGEKFLGFLQKNDLLQKVSCVIVSTLKGNAYEIQRIPVKGLSDYIQDTKGEKVLVTVAQRFQEEITDCLCENGCKNYEVISHEFLNAINIDSSYLLLEEKLRDC